MLIPLSQVLTLPALRVAEVRVEVGDPADAQIRWVHSSEVFEMGALLAGGELLLTTGLGLHGRTADQLAVYIDQLADAGCVALALELGRTFFEPPEAMRQACQRRGLCLLTLHAVVPFERVIEDFHELLVRRKIGAAGDSASVLHDLLAMTVGGWGLRALLDEIARLAGCDVELRDPEDRLVERSTIASSSDSSAVVAQVRDHEGLVGTLRLHGPSDPRLEMVAEQAALAVGVALSRSTAHGHYPSAAQSLLTDLAASALVSGADIAHRLAEAGWPWPDRGVVRALTIEVDPHVPIAEAVPIVAECFAERGRAPLVGVVGNSILALVVARPGQLPDEFRQDAASSAERLAERSAGPKRHAPLVAVGPAAQSPADLPGALARSREVFRVARRHGGRPGVVMARDVAVRELLSSGVERHAMAAFITEQIGPLIAHDRDRRTDLLRTLEVYLASGMSKTDAAAALGIRRQSLYERIARIERLLGASLSEPEQRTGLELALLAWRTRTGFDPGMGLGVPRRT